MSKRIQWGCDWCRAQGEGATPPSKWIEASYYDKEGERYRRYAFCSRDCMIHWLQERYQTRQQGENNQKGDNFDDRQSRDR